MAVPGPPDALWAAALLVWAIAAAVLGEAVRFVGGRWVPFWRVSEPIERFLLDLYLGGAALYLVAALPIDAFGRPVVFGLPIAAGLGLGVAALARRRAGIRPALDRTFSALIGWAPALALLTALGLYLVEISAALPVGTGNTYDSSLLTTYTALLLQHGHLPISFQPYASSMILYPQGTTVWLGAAQLDFGLPPARTALLVTPLFLSIAPLSGYVFGRRLFGTPRAGAAVALVVGALGPATRSLVGGSNDFAIAFPLVLLLAAHSLDWVRAEPPGWGDALGFGLILGYSAALNPVGADWLFPALLGLTLARGAPGIRGALRRLSRWIAALAASLVAIAPTLYVLALGLRSPGFVPGAPIPPTPGATGISLAQLYGSIDPFLFRAGDIELAPIPAVRAELAILLVVGVGLLLLWPRDRDSRPELSRFGGWALAAGTSTIAWLLLLTAAGAGWPVAREISYLSSGAELSIWLFTVYGLVAAVPLVLLFDRLARPPPSPSTPPSPSSGFRRARTGARSGPAALPAFALIVSLAILAPGIVLTPTDLSSVLREEYADFGSVSSADFALLACAGANLPAGSRVLVAPGSAAEFLPGYARGITLLYPLVPDWPWESAAYRTVVAQLTNGTLDSVGTSALASLHPSFIAVTMNNTVLWKAFWPNPFLHEPSVYPVVFHQGDAYLFSTDPSAIAFACG
ncbi:MAG: hypothetical protein WBG19_06210 [Thermoplasmata archaeon]